MFRNIQRTIKDLAVILALIGFIAIPVGIIIELALEGEGLFIGTISGGGLIIIIQSWFIYGYGQLIENSQETRKLLEQKMGVAKPNIPSNMLPDELPDL